MIQSEHDMPSIGSEMPPGNMSDHSENFSDKMPDSKNDMPAGNMQGNAENFSNTETATGGEMPRGNMSETSQNFTDQMAPPNAQGSNDMPVGSMTESNATAGYAQIPGTVNEMPSGNMNGEAGALNHGQNSSKMIEIPGTWKLVMNYLSA